MNIQRIVSLAPSITEIIFALEAEGNLIGVTKSCDYPEATKMVEKIGGYSTPNIEKINYLSPDLVLATDFHLKSSIVSQLKSKGINTYVIETKTPLDVPQAILLIGRLIGRQNKAFQLAQDIKIQIKTINDQVKDLRRDEKPRVCYICSRKPLRIARGPCCANKLIEMAGGMNIGTELLSQVQDAEVDAETIANKNPDIIIVGSGHGERVDLVNYVKNEALLHQTNAYQNNKVYQVQDDLVARFGPRVIEGAKLFAKLIHPEIFGSPRSTGSQGCKPVE